MGIYTLNPDGTLRPAGQPRPPTHAERQRSTAKWQRLRADQVAREPQCATCGSTTRLTADHITPLAHGGSIDGPLRTLCHSCNAREGAKLAGTTRQGRGGGVAAKENRRISTYPDTSRGAYGLGDTD